MSITRLPALRPVAAVVLVATLSGCAMMGRMSDRMSARMDAMSSASTASAMSAGSMSADESTCAALRTAAGEGRPPASSPVIVAGEHHLGAGGMGMARGDSMRMAGAGRVDRDSAGLAGGTAGSAATGATSSGATGSGAGAGGSMTGAVGRGSDAVSRRDAGLHGGATMAAGGNPLAWSHHMGGLHGPNSQPLARNQPTPEMRCGVDRSEVYVNP